MRTCVYIISSFILALLLIFMTYKHTLFQPNATKCWYVYVQINVSDHLRLSDNGNGNSSCDSGEFSLLSRLLARLLAYSPSAHCLRVHLSCERIMRLCLLLAIIIICERMLFIYLCALFTISLSAKKYLSSSKYTQNSLDALCTWHRFMYSITLFWDIFGLFSDFR